MTKMMKHTSIRLWSTLFLLGTAAFVLAGCGGMGAQATPLPTRTPLPTFTPTSEVAVAAPTVAPVEQPPQEQPAAQPGQEQPAQPPAQDQPAAPADTPTPAPTPTPQSAQLVLNDVVNVRSGPGTTYGLLGSEQQGASFRITGKNPEGTWWQIDYKGNTGWVFGQLVAVTGSEGVAVAQNIPPAPTAPPAPPPTNTPVPAPTAPPAPVEPPKPKYKFNIVVVSRCDRQPAGNWFEGTTYVNGQPQNGHLVAFSYEPDGPIVATILSGPHEGYPGWKTGFYSHIIRATNPQAGNWFVWIVDSAGQRISEIGNFQTTGPGEGCNQAVVDFDSR
jgi:hypothetical protein